MPAIKASSTSSQQGDGGTSSPHYNPIPCPPSRAASETASSPRRPQRRPSRSTSVTPESSPPPPEMEPERPDTPIADWPFERMNKVLLRCLSTRHLKDIAIHGPASLWESLAESDYSGEYDHLAEICEQVFPYFVAIPEVEAEMLATQLGLQILEQARVTPPGTASKEEHSQNTPPRISAPAEPETPKAQCKPHFTNPVTTSHQVPSCNQWT
ncbi:hypothetical protein AX15_003310 [Amanita polypyramis BW_CC]|nr:hypothetical protein AX15_003310 [Amanita polypyramis BW_CC]